MVASWLVARLPGGEVTGYRWLTLFSVACEGVVPSSTNLLLGDHCLEGD